MQALCCRPSAGSPEASERFWWAEVWAPQVRPTSRAPSPASPPTVINKYKRRRFQKTKNLLTGETEADPEMIKVNTNRASGPTAAWAACPQGFSSGATTEPCGAFTSQSCCFPPRKWGQEAELPPREWQGLQPRSQLASSRQSGALCTVHEPTWKPFASPLAGALSQGGLPEMSHLGSSRAGICTQRARPQRPGSTWHRVGTR